MDEEIKGQNTLRHKIKQKKKNLTDKNLLYKKYNGQKI